jgi:hypothetical protein
MTRRRAAALGAAAGLVAVVVMVVIDAIRERGAPVAGKAGVVGTSPESRAAGSYSVEISRPGIAGKKESFEVVSGQETRVRIAAEPAEAK